MQDLATTDAHAHAANVRSGLEDLKAHLRRDRDRVDDPRAKALFETAAEVLGGLAMAFEHFEQGRPAWK